MYFWNFGVTGIDCEKKTRFLNFTKAVGELVCMLDAVAHLSDKRFFRSFCVDFNLLTPTVDQL